MEVAARNHLGVLVFVKENQRVVGDRVQLDFHYPARIGDRIAHRAMHLWDAAQRIRVLHVERIVGPGESRTGQQFAHHCRAFDLARVRARGVDPGVEGARRAVHRLQAERPGQVGGQGQLFSVMGDQDAQRVHQRCPVRKGQALLGGQRHRA